MKPGVVHVGEEGNWVPIGSVSGTVNWSRTDPGSRPLPDVPAYIDPGPVSLSITTILPADALDWLLRPRCVVCNVTLAVRRVSDDFCGHDCQTAWHARRVQ